MTAEGKNSANSEEVSVTTHGGHHTLKRGFITLHLIEGSLSLLEGTIIEEWGMFFNIDFDESLSFAFDMPDLNKSSRAEWDSVINGVINASVGKRGQGNLTVSNYEMGIVVDPYYGLVSGDGKSFAKLSSSLLKPLLVAAISIADRRGYRFRD